MIKKWLTAERFPSMVGMEFDDAASANAAVLSVKRTAKLQTACIELVEPGDPELARKLEPESKGIARTMIKAHLVMGALGLVLGLMLAFALFAADVQMIAANPTIAFATLSAFGAVFGLMAGGLITLRPDHLSILHQARESSAAGKWFIVVHTRDSTQRTEAKRALEHLGNRDETVLQTI